MTERPRPVNHDQKWTRRCALEAAAIFMAGLRDVSPAAVEAVAVEFERHLDRPVDGTVAKTPAPPYAPPFAVASAWAPSPIAYPAPPVDPALGEKAIQELRENLQAYDPHEGREPEVANMVEGQKVTVRWNTGSGNAGSFMAITGVVHLREFGLEVEIEDPSRELRNQFAREITHEQSRRAAVVKEVTEFKGGVTQALGIVSSSSTQTVIEAARQRTEELDRKIAGLDTTTTLLQKTEDEKHELQQKITAYAEFAADVATSLNLEPSAAPNVVMNILRARLSECGDSANPIMRMGDISYKMLVEKLGGKPGDSVVTLAGRVRHQRDSLKAENEDLEKELDAVRFALGAGNADSGVGWYFEHEDTVDAARRVRAKADGRTSQEEKS